MSLYNMVKGYNLFAGLCLAILKLDVRRIPRFRDAWFSDDGTQIIVLTRTGGGNRDDYVAQNEWMREPEGYVEDWDDEFDSTFARFTYNVPREYQADTTVIADMMQSSGGGAYKQGPGSIIETLDQRRPQPEKLDPAKLDAAASAAERIVAKLKVAP